MMQGAQTVLCDNIEGGMGREAGGSFQRREACVYLWLLQVDIWQKPTQYCQAIVLRSKTSKFK